MAIFWIATKYWRRGNTAANCNLELLLKWNKHWEPSALKDSFELNVYIWEVYICLAESADLPHEMASELPIVTTSLHTSPISTF